MSQSAARKARRAGSREYHAFRLEMLGRARFRCERCGRRPPDDRDLHVHHPYEVAEGGEALDYGNAEVVCVTCHRQHHSGAPRLDPESVADWDEIRAADERGEGEPRRRDEDGPPDRTDRAGNPSSNII